VRSARELTCEWGLFFVPQRFDLAGFCTTVLEVSLAHEIRPEGRDHARTLYEAQRETMHGIYGPLLDGLVAEGALTREGDEYVQARLPGGVARLRVRIHLRVSKLRTTLRLLKQPFLYDGWLDYIVHKVERNTDLKIDLDERERRRPLVYLWPRILRYVRSRPQRGD